MRATFGSLILLLFLPRLCSQQPSGPAIGGEAAIEAAVLDVNNQMTRAAEDRDADRLFSFVLDTGKGSIIQNGALLLTRGQTQVFVLSSGKWKLLHAHHSTRVPR